MNDRELLELAAKAGGYPTDHPWNKLRIEHNPPIAGLCIDGVSTNWNPKDHNSDSFGLMVKCAIDVEREGETVVAWYSCPYPGWDNGKVGSWVEPIGDNPETATRIAILMAAAEIGKAM